MSFPRSEGHAAPRSLTRLFSLRGEDSRLLLRVWEKPTTCFRGPSWIVARRVEENVSFPCSEGQVAPRSLTRLLSLRGEDSRLLLRVHEKRTTCFRRPWWIVARRVEENVSFPRSEGQDSRLLLRVHEKRTTCFRGQVTPTATPPCSLQSHDTDASCPLQSGYPHSASSSADCSACRCIASPETPAAQTGSSVSPAGSQ